MSALRIIKLKPGTARAFACESGCRRATADAPLVPSHRAFICGYRAADLCKRCAKSWAASWSGEQVTLRVKVDPFDATYLVKNPEVIESAIMGPVLQGRFWVEGEEDRGQEWGGFRMDRLALLEPVDEQLELGKAA